MKIDRTIYTKEWLEKKHIKEQMPVLQIAKLVGCANHTMKKLIIEYGIQLRTASEAAKFNRKSKINKELYTKEWLHEQYHINKMSLNQIAELVNCCVATILKWMVKYNISRRTFKEGIKLNPPVIINRKKGEEHYLFGMTRSDDIRDKISDGKCRFNKSIYNKDWLYEQYWVNNLTLNDMSTIIGCKYTTLKRWIIKNDIILKTKSECFRGENNPSWRGGKTTLYDCVRNCEYNLGWKKSVLVRDNFCCVLCGNTKKLEIDHIKPFAVILEENKITTFNEALSCVELWNINNGRTLCKKCHKKTDTYGQKTKKLLEEIRRII